MPRTEIVSTFSLAIALAVGGALIAPSQDAEAAAAPGNSMEQSRTSSSPDTMTMREKINKLPADKAGEIDSDVFHAQVLLDAAGFSPGVIDGMEGNNFTKALRGFQEAKGLDVSGELDQATRTALLRDRREPTKRLKIDSSVVDGNYVRDFPDSAEEQAELERLNYRNLLEEVAERFHTTPGVIMSLNDPTEPFGIGSVVTLPNVLPASRDYSGDVYADHRNWFNAMNVNATSKKGERILVDESEGVLKVFDAEDTLVATFPVTTGSERDPLPIGDWEVQTFTFLPPFSYQPDLFWDVPDSEEDQMLPPGPNGPVGVAWLDLTKEHYGLHGTSEPETIGYAQSHGCLRMTNWDVLKLAYMMEPGFAAEFVE